MIENAKPVYDIDKDKFKAWADNLPKDGVYIQSKIAALEGCACPLERYILDQSPEAISVSVGVSGVYVRKGSPDDLRYTLPSWASWFVRVFDRRTCFNNYTKWDILGALEEISGDNARTI